MTRTATTPEGALAQGPVPARARLRLLGVALTLIACGGGDAPLRPADAPPPEPPPAVFADAGLEAAVRAALDAPLAVLDSADLLALTRLPAPGFGIASVAGIERLANLEVLDLADNAVRDLAPLAALRRLEFLDLENNRVVDVAPLRPLTRLRFVGLSYNAVADIAPLLSLPVLASVSLEGTPLNEASRSRHLATLVARGVQVSAGLSGLAAAVDDDAAEVAFVNATLEDRVRQAVGKPSTSWPQPLTRADVKNLRTLAVPALEIAEIQGLEALTGLFTLNLSSNGIDDLWPVAGLTELSLLTLPDNLIADVAALSELTSLTFLNLEDNRVRDVAPLARLPKLATLYLRHNRVEDIAPLLGLPALRTVTLEGNPLDAEAAGHVATLRGRGVNVRL